MKKIVLVKPYTLEMVETPIPEPKSGEIRIKVARVGICGSDPTIYRGNHPYVEFPVVMGHEYSGWIDEAGADTDSPATGTRVTVIPHLVCDECAACKAGVYNFCEQLRCTGAEADGAHAEYICVPAKMVMPIPDGMSLEDAAMVEPACVAYHGAKRANPTADDTVLIVGAGPIGAFCMQSCKALGAKKVYIADMDSWRLKLAQDLGADGIIDVSEENLEDGLTRLAGNPKNIDVFYDCVGEKGRVMNQILRFARRGTRVVIVGVLQNGYDLPNLPDFVQHELSLFGTTMYVPQDYKDVIGFMGKKIIRTTGMVTHTEKLENIQKVFDMIEGRRVPFFKIMLTVVEEY